MDMLAYFLGKKAGGGGGETYHINLSGSGLTTNKDTAAAGERVTAYYEGTKQCIIKVTQANSPFLVVRNSDNYSTSQQLGFFMPADDVLVETIEKPR